MNLTRSNFAHIGRWLGAKSVEPVSVLVHSDAASAFSSVRLTLTPVGVDHVPVIRPIVDRAILSITIKKAELAESSKLTRKCNDRLLLKS